MYHSTEEVLAKIQVMLTKAENLKKLEGGREFAGPDAGAAHKYYMDDIRALAADIVNDGKENG